MNLKALPFRRSQIISAIITETLAEQVCMQRKTKELIEAIDDLGNPFEEVHNKLIALDSHDCTNSSVIDAFEVKAVR